MTYMCSRQIRSLCTWTTNSHWITRFPNLQYIIHVNGIHEKVHFDCVVVNPILLNKDKPRLNATHLQTIHSSLFIDNLSLSILYL